MTFAPADIDDPQEAARVRAAICANAQIRQEALREHVRDLGLYEQQLVSRPVDQFDAADFTALGRLLWAYRRRLPRSVRASLTITPDDPILREHRASEAA